MNTNELLKELKIKESQNKIYMAGLPSFPSNFPRDSIISAILMQDMQMLKEQLEYSATLQGEKSNKFDGEEPGKIHHEVPEVIIGERSTKYNACDTTALFLIGHELYQKRTGDKNLFGKFEKNINLAIDYIKNHIVENAFVEDPKFSWGEKFALEVTYWKDSKILDRKEGEPKYPIVYTLAHAQNMRAMESAYYLTKKEDYKLIAERMFSYLIENLYDYENDNFYLARDQIGPIKAYSSDPLHMLIYLNPENIDQKIKEGIINSSKKLETKLGYRTLSEEDGIKVNDDYHSKSVWPFEQAIIHNGAYKFEFKEIEENAKKVMNYLEKPQELFLVKNGNIIPDGNPLQLWSIAAYEYFNNFEKEKFLLLD